MKNKSNDLEELKKIIKETIEKETAALIDRLSGVLKEEIDLSIPISIFNEYLTPFETIVKYLREEKALRFSEMNTLLCRDQRVLSMTYRRTKKKHPKKLKVEKSKYYIPLSIFKNTQLSIFENIVLFLKNQQNLKNRQICKLLKRNNKTIWTVYSRASIKNGSV